jgi:predicted phage baseplate assembly protein
MALIGPILDDRSFEQLKDELVARIPVYAPEWTDHNESDPGIALLELFAYLGESLLYRFNQIPDATKIAFLRLLGLQPRPAQRAHTLLVLQTEQPQGIQVLRDREARASSVVFQTEDEVYAWPLETYAVGKDEAAVPGKTDKAELNRRKDAIARLPLADQERVQKVGETFYVVSAVPADPAAPDATPLDVSRTVDGTLWVALLSRTGALRGQLAAALATRTVFVGVAPDEAVTPYPFNLVPRPTTRWTVLKADDVMADPPAALWQLWNGPVESRSRKAADPDFVTLAVLGDTSRGLTTPGVVKVGMPDRLPQLDPAVQPSGDRASPPPINDPKIASRLVAWLRASRPANENDAIHGIRWVGVNAVSAIQCRTAPAELLGTGTGDPGQTYPLTQHPVVPGSLQLEVEESDGWHPWAEVDTFVDSKPLDRHYTVDLVAGLVHFGARARVPQIGQRIRVVSYRFGGGTDGNLPAGAITSLSDVAGVKVTNILPAAGGADAASLTEALEEIPAEVNHRDRAVAADDFRALALEVQGVRRAEPLPLLHPDTPSHQAAGVMSVLIFPAEDRRNPGAPEPDMALLRRVAAYLNPRRLVTCELYVIPPTYRKVAVSVGVHVRSGYQVDAVRRWVELILRQYLAPLPDFGPDGDGWPLGQAVRRAELEAVAVQVDGVEYLEDELKLARLDESGAWVTEQQRVELQKWEVPELAAITVVAGIPLPPGSDYQPSGAGGDTPVLVPLPPDVC